jgi:hypothetical protein
MDGDEGMHFCVLFFPLLIETVMGLCVIWRGVIGV